MIVSTDIKIRSGIKIDLISFPNFAIDKNMVPHNITIYENDTLATDITVKLFNNGQNVFDYQEPYFQLFNSINLTDFKYLFDKGCNIELMVLTSSKNWKDYRIQLEYIVSKGVIIYQQKTTNVDKVLKEITEKGVCTRLIVSFNKKITQLKIMSVFRPISIEADEPWFYPIEIADSEDNSYMIDFTGENRIYSKYLDFMKMSYVEIESTDKAPGDVDLQIYITAYGFLKI